MHIAPTTPVETKSPPYLESGAMITLLDYFVNILWYCWEK
ncbi:hypothetical protein MNB_SV-3-660 [hydrothermal vent metagenome]|uniref:Uncharacterized protein n=1 Tax=hydrothermal vent metagenome TaxID=652676 RepID=A0A1W1CKZ0_9ZZZZ